MCRLLWGSRSWSVRQHYVMIQTPMSAPNTRFYDMLTRRSRTLHICALQNTIMRALKVISRRLRWGESHFLPFLGSVERVSVCGYYLLSPLHLKQMFSGPERCFNMHYELENRSKEIYWNDLDILHLDFTQKKIILRNDSTWGKLSKVAYKEVRLRKPWKWP